MDTDDQLFLKVKNDDSLSYNQLFMRYYSRLCAYVFEFTKNEVASEDIVQELFIRLWTDRKRICIRERVSSYLFKSSRNSALNYLRAEKNKQKAINNLPLREMQAEDNLAEYNDFLTYLEECIGMLPKRCKQVFIMSRMDGLKHIEISNELNISVKTIKNQVWKSLQYLRSCLQLKDVM